MPQSRHPFSLALAGKTKQTPQRLTLYDPNVWITFWEGEEPNSLCVYVISQDARDEGCTVRIWVTDSAGTAVWEGKDRPFLRKSARSMVHDALTIDRDTRLRFSDRDLQVCVEVSPWAAGGEQLEGAVQDQQP